MKVLCRYRGAFGMSLAEVLVALLIMGVVGAAVAGGFYTTVKGNSAARLTVTAESLARSELEYVISQSYTPYPWSYTLPGGALPSAGWATHTLPPYYDGYSLTVAAAQISGYSGTTDIQNITVVVHYGGADIFALSAYQAR